MFENMQAEKIVKPPYEIAYLDKEKDIFLVFNEKNYNDILYQYFYMDNNQDISNKKIELFGEVNGNKKLIKLNINEIFKNLKIISAAARVHQKPAKNRKTTKYYPFEVKDLFLKIAKIDELNYNSIINFYNDYGLLYDAVAISTKKIMGISFPEHKDSYKHILYNINDLRICINLYYSLTVNNIDYESIKKSGIVTSNLNMEPGKLNIKKFPEVKKINEQNNIRIAKKILMKIINKHINDIYFDLYLDDNEKIVSSQNTKSLFAVAHFQLYQKIINDEPIKKCKFCGSPFISEVAIAKYCPPSKNDPNPRCYLSN